MSRRATSPGGRALRTIAWPAAALAASAWLILLVLPIGALFGSLLESGGTASRLVDPIVLAVARMTFLQALVSAAIASLLGLGLGLLARPTRAMRAILAIPFAVPTVVAAAAWIAWLGRTGWLAQAGWTGASEWLYSFRAVILAHVALNAPWIALQVSLARMDVPANRLNAAATLGAGPWARFRFVIFPEIRGAWVAAGAQVMSLCSMSFALVLLLGGGPPVETLETTLYSHVRFGALDLPGAGACAIWQLLIASLPWALVLGFRRLSGKTGGASLETGGGSGGRPLSRGRGGWAWAAAALFILPYLAVYAPFFSAVAREQIFSPDSLAQIVEPLRASILIAVGSALGAVVLALAGVAAAASFGSWLALPFTLSSGVSVLVLGLGFWFAFRSFIDPFAGSLGAMIALQVAVFAPLVFRSLWPVASRARMRCLEAAWSLGASPTRAFLTVEWPRWRAPLISAAALVAALSIGEVAAVSLFYSEHLVPLPLLLTRLASQYRFAEAQALAAVLFTLSSAGIILITLWGESNVEDLGR